MKNLTFKAAMLKGSRPTVNRRSTDGQSQRRYSLTPITKRWRALMTLVFLFTFAIGNVMAADNVFTFPTSGSITTQQSHSITGTGTACIDGNKIYHETNQSYAVSGDFGMEANKLGVAFKPTKDCQLAIKYGSNTTSSRTITSNFYKAADARLYQLFVDAADVNKGVSKYVLDNYTADQEWWKNQGLIKYSSKKYQEDAGNGAKAMSGEAEKTGLRTSWFTNTALTIAAKSNETKVIEAADTTVIFRANQEYFIYATRNSSGVGYMQFIFTPVYTVTLNLDGGSFEETPEGWKISGGNYTKMTASTTLPTPTKEGKDFDGWMNPSSEKVESPYAPSAAITLTAKWKDAAPRYAITYSKGEYGTGEIAGGEKVEGVAYTLSSDRFTRAGYVQTGWSLTDGGTKAYDLGGSYTTDAAREFFPVWAETSTYVASFDSGEGCSASTPAGWTFANAGSYGAEVATADYECKFGSTCPASGSAANASYIAFAKSASVYATYDLGVATTVSAVTGTFYVGSSSARTFTIDYLGADETTVLHTITVNHPSGSNWGANNVNETAVVDNVRYIKVKGMASNQSWIVMSAFSVTYVDLVTKYNVSFDKNGGSGDDMTTLKYAEGAEVTLPACSFTAPTNMEFDAWTSTDVTISNNKFTMPNKAVTIKATWKAIVAKYTVIFKDGDVTLGTKQFDVASNPSDADIEKTKPLYTFAAWQKDAADIALDAAFWATVAKDAEVTLIARYTPAYATSINIEQWVLDNGAGKGATTKTSALLAEMGTKNYLSNITWENKNNELDTLDDSKTDGKRNYAYLGLKVKKDASNVRLLLQDGKSLKVKFGNVAATPNIKIGDADATAMTITDGVYSLDAASGDREITISTTSAGAVVIKQIMINEDIAAVTLPWRVTYDANGGTCATAEAIWSGAALILPDVTPADADHTFAGWYDEATGGELQGVAGASYTPTDNETLFAHFAPVEYAVNYAAGDHGSGDMAAANVGWGTEYKAVANGFTPETGYIFAGWAVSGVDGVSSIAAGGSFTMPKNPVTLTALWEDNSKVAVIVETNVKYESLADAVAAATDGQTIQLLQNNNVTAQVEVAEKAITLDLAGYKIEYTGTSTLPSGVILVHNGASLTIDDSSDPDAGSIVSGEKAYAAIALTKAGDDAANPATLVVNGGTLTGHYYGITGNGSRNNTDITINGGTITGTVGIAIYHPQVGTLTVNNGSLTGEDAAIEMRAGTLVINDGTFTATATVFSCDPNGSGSTTSGAAIAIAQHTTKKDIEVTINGGTFNGVKALNESNPQVNDPAPQVTMAVTAGTFTGEVSTVDVHEFISGGTYDAPVASENCAPGYVPSAEVAPGVYTVVPKDGVEIIGVVTTGGTNKTVTGLYKGDASVNLDNSKKLADGKYIFVTLKEGYTFEENDVLIIDLAAKSDLGGGTKALEITTGIGNIDGAVWKSIAFDDYDGSDTISLEGIALGQTSIGLKRSANQNAKVNGIKVLRPMKPVLSAITIDGRDGVIDEANKTVAVTIPHDADLAALTVVPTIVWNEAAASNSIVVNDGSAWIEGANTYKLTDKDNDYTVYTITLTRDVLKHTVSFNTHGGSAVASEEVVHGGYLAAAPADPTKEENVFKHWAETEDGEAVDVTTVQINADKTFHAVWEAEPAGIKLFNGNVLNTTNFISAAATTIEISEVEYPCLVAFASNRTSLAGAKQGDLVMYSATTDAAKIKFDLYNANSSAKTAYVWVVEEGDAEATQLDAIEVAGTTRVKTAYYEFNGTKNRTVYLTSGSKADIKVLQAKVIESGSAIKQFGDAGYTLKLNQGRIAAATTAPVQFEGATVNVSSDYAVLNNSNLSTKSYIKFTTTVDKMILHVEKSGGKFYVSQDPEDKGTIYNANTDVELTPAGEWYLGSETSGSAASFTNIAFIAPKCAEPQFNALANSDVCAGDGYVALDGTATVADAGVPTYQWYREDNSAIDGETNATYTPTADGKYYVIAVNHLAGYTDNEKKSALVTVTTHAGTVITEPLVDLRGAENAELALTVEATGKNLHYAWKESATIDGTYTDVAGATDSKTLNVTVTEGMDKYYKVVVSSDCGSDLESVAHVTQFVPVSQQDVTASIVWDWTEAASVNEIKLTASTTPKKNEGFVMANGAATVYNNANFQSDKLYLEGEYIIRTEGGKLFQGQTIKFNTTVAGAVRVTFSHTGSNKPARELFINGVGTGTSVTGTSQTETGLIEVPAGEVAITAFHVNPTDGAGQQYVRVYKIEFYALAHQRTTGYNAGDLGTVILEDETFIEGANLYELAGLNENGYLAFDEITTGDLEAGKPYLFEVTNPSSISFYKPVGAAHSDTEIETNGMIGTFSGTTLYQGSDNYYYFSGRHIWKVNDFTVAIPIPAHRCYVDMDVLQSAGPAQQQAPGRRRVTLGVQGTQVATGIEDVDASEKPVKLLINGQMYILRGEKLFDATGRLVK